jgi:uncharacterized membrane protein
MVRREEARRTVLRFDAFAAVGAKFAGSAAKGQVVNRVATPCAGGADPVGSNVPFAPRLRGKRDPRPSYSSMPELPLPPPPADPEFCVVARRNSSLDTRQRWQIFALLAFVSLTVALSFVVVGAWPVLPYSALELVALAIAFVVIERRARDWERITVAGDRVIVERMLGGRRQQREFNRHWLKVDVRERGFAHEPQITLRFAGEAMEFGAALQPVRRVEVAKALRRLTAGR